MPETPGELFTTIPVELFRRGNTAGARLDNVRPTDVDIVKETMPNGEVIRMVHPRGGISTFDRIHPRMPGKWWRIPAGTTVPDTIRVVRDKPDPVNQVTHYSLRPTHYMTLLAFITGLQTLALKAQPMFGMSGGSNEAQSGDR